jgi:hypothetical protein
MTNAETNTSSQLNEAILVKPAKDLAQRVRGRGSNLSLVEMELSDAVSSYWPSTAQPGAGCLHLLVRRPLAGTGKFEWLVPSRFMRHALTMSSPSPLLLAFSIAHRLRFPHCHCHHPRSLLPLLTHLISLCFQLLSASLVPLSSLVHRRRSCIRSALTTLRCNLSSHRVSFADLSIKLHLSRYCHALTPSTHFPLLY